MKASKIATLAAAFGLTASVAESQTIIGDVLNQYPRGNGEVCTVFQKLQPDNQPGKFMPAGTHNTCTDGPLTTPGVAPAQPAPQLQTCWNANRKPQVYQAYRCD